MTARYKNSDYNTTTTKPVPVKPLCIASLPTCYHHRLEVSGRLLLPRHAYVVMRKRLPARTPRNFIIQRTWILQVNCFHPTRGLMKKKKITKLSFWGSSYPVKPIIDTQLDHIIPCPTLCFLDLFVGSHPLSFVCPMRGVQPPPPLCIIPNH